MTNNAISVDGQQKGLTMTFLLTVNKNHPSSHLRLTVTTFASWRNLHVYTTIGEVCPIVMTEERKCIVRPSNILSSSW